MIFKKISKNGMTLIEVLVTGSLFAIILTMAGRAMVLGHRAQSSLSHKINIRRGASNALDKLVREVEMGGTAADLNLNVAGSTVLFPTLTPPNTFRAVDGPTEFRIDRMQRGITIFDLPNEVSVGYWRDARDSTLRRSFYNDSGAPMPGYPEDGKILVQDVHDFEVKLEVNPVTGLDVLTVRLKVATLGDWVQTEISVERP